MLPQMNTTTYSVPSNASQSQNAGAALFGVGAPASTAAPTNPGAALFGGADATPAPAPPEANPFADPSGSVTSGSATPAQSIGGDVNPFAADPIPEGPQKVFSPLGGSAVGTPHRGSIVAEGLTEVKTTAEEVNPFSDGTTASVKSPPVPDANPFADDSAAAPIPIAKAETENPFGDVPGPPAVLAKQDSAFSVKSNKSTASAASKELVKEMVGGLDVSNADMIDKLENATTPTGPKKPESAQSTDTESDTESESEGKNKVDDEDDDDEEVIDTKPTVIKTESNKVETKVESESDTETETEEAALPPKVEEERKVEEKKESDSDSDSEVEAPAPAPQSSSTPGLMTGGTAAGLFDVSSSGTGYAVEGTAASIFSAGDGEAKPGLSTGHAIFTDAPSVPDIQSTGAAIFGIGDESAAGSTGAAIFDISAPTAQPCHGEMSGWDEAFDKKFDTASTAVMNPNVAFDAFGSNAPQPTPFGYPGVDAAQDDTAFCDSFGMASLEADLNNPFKSDGLPGPGGKKSGDGESPDSILFEADTSKPLDPWPGLTYDGDGWEMFIRHPPKKKITAQRYWKKVWVRIVMQADTPAVLLINPKDDKDPIQELPLQAAYSLSEISHQVFDQFTKVFTIKLQYIFYKERAGIRPGQVTKMQKLTDKIGALAKAVEDADLKGVKTFASDMKKLGVPLEHAPQISELLKLASFNYEDMKMFSSIIEEKLFRVEVNRDKALTYKTEECQLTAVEEVLVDQDAEGHVSRKICRVRVFFLSFLTGMPMVELGVNDMTRIGKEVVGRHDILPVPTEQWIRYEDIHFHSIVDKKEFDKNDHIIKFKPPDACYLEIMRFRVRPPRARELPMQARCNFIISGQKVEIRADMMIPYPHTKAWGQVPCEDVAMRIPLPECWIYQFRTEKAHISFSSLAAGNIALSSRMGSVKSAHRRAGKVKGLERFLGTMETQAQELMETSSGEAKYEHQHKSIVWRVGRLPKLGQGSYTNHEFICKLQLTSYDQMPETFEKNFYVEFTQPATTVSNTVLRSVSINPQPEDPPEKFVKYLARHEYKLEIEFSEKQTNSYLVAAKLPVKEPSPPPSEQGDPDFPEERQADSDSDSD